LVVVAVVIFYAYQDVTEFVKFGIESTPAHEQSRFNVKRICRKLILELDELGEVEYNIAWL
jgi:hypothetical protein